MITPPSDSTVNGTEVAVLNGTDQSLSKHAIFGESVGAVEQERKTVRSP